MTYVSFYRGFGAIGPFVNMVYKMCAGDMSRFGIIYIVFVLGLTQGKFLPFKDQAIHPSCKFPYRIEDNQF